MNPSSAPRIGHDSWPPNRKLVARGVGRRFRLAGSELTVLQDLNLEVNSNELVSIVGPSGCGKSTFLHMVAGLVEPSSGEIWVDGQPVQGPGPDRGMVFQTYTLFPWLTVFQNVLFPLRWQRHLSPDERTELVWTYLRAVGLADFADAYPGQLSGGMRQRVAIARAFAARPSVLLMDEPFGALDAQTRRWMQELLLEVWDQHRVTILFVTHDVEEAIFLADRVYVMTARPGRIKAEISVPLARPRSYDVQTSPEFIALRRHIVELLREETPWRVERSASR